MAKNPINKNSMKKLFDTVSPMGPDAAEKFVRELLKAGEERRRDAEKIIAEVAVAGRKSAEQFGEAVQREVAKQLTKAVKRIDHLEKQVETLTRSLEATRAVLVATAAKSVADSVAKRKTATTTTTGTTTATTTTILTIGHCLSALLRNCCFPLFYLCRMLFIYPPSMRPIRVGFAVWL
jgi:polyhydroxyalkanoate synthesis regulator phasin